MNAIQSLAEVVRLLKQWRADRPYERVIPKTFTPSALTLSGSSGAISTFDSTGLQNEKYPFRLEQVDVIDTTSESNWQLQLKDRSTDWAIYNYVRTRMLRGTNQSAGTEKAGRPTSLARMPGGGYIVGPNGGFIANARSAGTASVTELSLRGVWIVEI